MAESVTPSLIVTVPSAAIVTYLSKSSVNCVQLFVYNLPLHTLGTALSRSSSLSPLNVNVTVVSLGYVTVKYFSKFALSPAGTISSYLPRACSIVCSLDLSGIYT